MWQVSWTKVKLQAHLAPGEEGYETVCGCVGALLGCLGPSPLQPLRGEHNSVEVLGNPLFPVIQKRLVLGLCHCRGEDLLWGFFSRDSSPDVTQG